ncbi:hypothetical protein MRB53_038824 [Persea americana]|nr:hypothetical protein MRB53_038824 [Persea americana]
MAKRSHDQSDHHSHKKHKSNNHSQYDQRLGKDTQYDPRQDRDKPPQSQNDSSTLPPASSKKAEVPSFVPFKTTGKLPDLPALSKELAETPFRHSSVVGYDRASSASDISYERLEFLGDAYLEVIASRLIFHHFPNLTAGNQSQVRELLVKNETLAEYAKAYEFEKKLKLNDIGRLIADSQGRGNKGYNKILGDSFEAYVAALILGDAEHGFAIAEKWLTELWTPKLVRAAKSHGVTASSITTSDDDPLNNYNPTAKADLQHKILGRDIKLEYEAWKPTIELKGDKIGQNRHFIALYLTGWDHTRKLLGKGEGRNKVEAGNRAAMEAMHGETKDLVEECAIKLRAIRDAKRKEREELEKA